MKLPIFLTLSLQAAVPLFASIDVIPRIIKEIRTNGKAYADLKELTSIGSRLSGSQGAEKAVAWGKNKMESYGFDKVWLEELKAPKWERGKNEGAVLKLPSGDLRLKLAALGNSVATPEEGIEAEVLEVKNLKEVETLGKKLSGKIVFYNQPMDTSLPSTFEAYGKVISQRTKGAAKASPFGAVGVVIRSLTTLPDDDHPHTGVMSYGEAPKIPAGALSSHGANLLSAALKVTPDLKLRMTLSSRSLPDVPSYNVIGEIQGSKLPLEYVLIGGHLDSWDLGPGAHDDGAGVVQSIEVLRAVKTLGLRPTRSLRAVLFMSEEFGGYGGQQYAERVKTARDRPIAAMESDRGGSSPRGFSLDGSKAFLSKITSWKKYLALVGASEIVSEGGGTDVEPLKRYGIPVMDLLTDGRHYFDLHHSALDTVDKVSPTELHEGAAALATLAYLIAEEGTQNTQTVALSSRQKYR